MPARKAVPTPKPQVVQTVCSMCGLDWSRHKKDATAEECIRLLKADLSFARAYKAEEVPFWSGPITVTNKPPMTTTLNEPLAMRITKGTAMIEGGKTWL